MADEIEMNTATNVVPTTPMSDGIHSFNPSGRQQCRSQPMDIPRKCVCFIDGRRFRVFGIVAMDVLPLF